MYWPLKGILGRTPSRYTYVYIYHRSMRVLEFRIGKAEKRLGGGFCGKGCNVLAITLRTKRMVLAHPLKTSSLHPSMKTKLLRPQSTYLFTEFQRQYYYLCISTHECRIMCEFPAQQFVFGLPIVTYNNYNLTFIRAKIDEICCKKY